MKNAITLFILFLFFNNSFTQTACGIPSDDPPGCFMCTNVYSGSNAGYGPGVPGPTFPCGSIENNLWLSVIADGSSISVNVLVGTCANNQGLEVMIYDQNLNPLNPCFGGGGTGPGQVANVSASGLTPGEVYWIMIDGFAGDVCDFTVTATGIQTSGTPVATPSISGPVSACPGAVGTYALTSQLPNNPTYNWTVPAGTRILSGQGTPSITVEFINPGSGLIQCNNSYPCSTGIPSPPYFVQYTPIPPTFLPPIFVCSNDFPIVINGNTFSQPGTYTFIENSYLDCDSSVVYNIFPKTQSVNILDSTICFGNTVEVNGKSFNSSGRFTEVIPGGAANGCDSIIELNLTVLGDLSGIPNPTFLDCNPNATAIIDASSVMLPPGSTFSWTLLNGANIISGGNTLTPLVNAPGDYRLDLLLINGNQTCASSTTITVETSNGPVLPFFDLFETNQCATDTGYYVLSPLFNADTVLWIFNNQDSILTTNRDTLKYPWQHRGGVYNIRVRGFNNCGVGPELDTTINLLPLANPDLVGPADRNSCTFNFLEYTWSNTQFPLDSMVWDLDGGQFSPDHNPPGFNSIFWKTFGRKEIELYLKDEGCTSLAFRDTINLTQSDSKPFLECKTTENSIEFSWLDLIGSPCMRSRFIWTTGVRSGTTYAISWIECKLSQRAIAGLSMPLQIAIRGKTR
ncbi:MAG: hypothetical protein R2784_16035 [Saprospiraceae bacterium]